MKKESIMGASPGRIRRWLWPALALSAMVIVLSAGRGALARTDHPAHTAASGTVYLPYLGTPRPPQIELIPYAVSGEDITLTVITHAGDERLFIGNREGQIWIVNPDGTINPTLFLDIKDKVRFQDNFEQGLLGLAFHPDFPDTPYFYIAYTTSGHIQIARGVVDPSNPNHADPGSLRSLMSIRKPPASGGPSPVHNAGDLAFGPDRYLYIPVGDGGPDPYDPAGVPGDPFNNSQRRDTMLGSILRIDPDPAGGLPPDCGNGGLYSIPADNPWLNDGGCDEIWAIGLRNPWRMSIDPLTGDFYFGDVGEWLREEIDYYPGNAPGGANFGWHCWEGTIDYTTVHPEIANTCNGDNEYIFPIHEYDHTQGECAVIGGKIYRGSQFPALYGRYFFGDWCSGRLWVTSREGSQWKVEEAGDSPLRFSTFGNDVHGELYGGVYESGILYKVVVH